MVTTGHAQRADIKILGHCSVSVCLYVCLCVQSGTISKVPRCHVVSILCVSHEMYGSKSENLASGSRKTRHKTGGGSNEQLPSNCWKQIHTRLYLLKSIEHHTNHY